MKYEVREECHSKFGGPVPEGKNNICEFQALFFLGGGAGVNLVKHQFTTH